MAVLYNLQKREAQRREHGARRVENAITTAIKTAAALVKIALHVQRSWQ
jgi:hypothetical protein